MTVLNSIRQTFFHLLLASLLLPSGCASAENKPVWWDSDIGISDAILPGFIPIEKQGDRLVLYEREYTWAKSFLPIQIQSLGTQLATLELVIVDKEGNESVVVPNSFRWIRSSSARAVYEATGRWRSLQIDVQATVEYDGVIDVALKLTPAQAIEIEGLRFQARIHERASSVVLGFKAAGIRRQKDRTDRLTLPYAGEFIHALNVSDGNRSLWWFADNNKGWLNSSTGPVTEVTSDAGAIVLKQHIVAGAHELASPVQVRFGLLATPVKPIEASQRTKRATSKYHSREEQKLGATFKLWWPIAFAYDAYPYTHYVGERQNQLEPSDLKAYPGLTRNLRIVREGREHFGFHWLPYFSAHVLSTFDETVVEHREQWEILPRKVFRDGLLPYSKKFDKPVLTHNAPGYSNYLLWRIDKLIDELDVEGIYLDHGPPHDSRNPLNGGWLDDSGELQPSLDIFAMRSFMQRLRTIFVQKGKQGYTFIHVSNREIIPALTFAYGIADGEQYKRRVRDANYLDLVSLDEFRARFAAEQYGVPNYWIHIDWANHRHNRAWENSQRQKIDYRRTMGLALLHDLPLWQHGSHQVERRRLFSLLDRLPFDAADFDGYWNSPPFVSTNNGNVKISQYRHMDKVLNVIANVSNTVQTAKLQIADRSNACRAKGISARLTDPHSPIKSLAGENTVTLEPYDFQIVTLLVSNKCSF